MDFSGQSVVAIGGAGLTGLIMKTTAELDLTSEITLDEGLRHLIKWHRAFIAC